VEISEISDHPFMLGTQFHPELQSRPNRPHPLFREFVTAVKRSTEGAFETPAPAAVVV
jgi:CTP synthase